MDKEEIATVMLEARSLSEEVTDILFNVREKLKRGEGIGACIKLIDDASDGNALVRGKLRYMLRLLDDARV